MKIDVNDFIALAGYIQLVAGLILLYGYEMTLLISGSLFLALGIIGTWRAK